MNLNKPAITFFFVMLSFFCKAQYAVLWSESDIRENEARVLKAYHKYVKKQSKEPLRDEFLTAFHDRINVHNAAINAIIKEDDHTKNWLGWINRLRSLDFIYNSTSDMLIKNNIEQQHFTAKIDSVKHAALVFLHTKSMNILEGKPSAPDYASAYRALSIVQLLHPGYKNTETLLNGLLLLGNKGAVLYPIEMGNAGTYTHVQVIGVSDLSEHITGNVLKSLSKSVGFVMQEQADGTTAYTIRCTWTSINFNTGYSNKNKLERTATVNSEEVTATVEYTTQRFNMDASFDVVIMDKISGSVIGKKTIGTSDFADYVTATYTGDSKALTYEDMSAVNNRSSLNDFQKEQVQICYDRNIHAKLCDYINSMLGW
jgi:hypothetical protein